MDMQGKARAETIGRAKMRGKREQGKATEANINGKRDHGEVIKFRAPGAVPASTYLQPLLSALEGLLPALRVLWDVHLIMYCLVNTL